MKQILLILLLSLTITNYAQTTPDFQYQFDGEVKWMMLTNTGTLIASTGEALVGIKPNSNKISFKFDKLKKVKQETMQYAQGTPYLMVVPKGFMNQGHISIVDVVKGTIAFDSKAEKWQGGVKSKYIIQPEMLLVVNGTNNNKEKLGKNYMYGTAIYDLKTGEFVKMFKRKAANPMVGKPDINGDNIIIPGAKNIICYSISTGAVKWTANVKNATNIIINDETNEIYAFRVKGTNTVVYKINAETGNLSWNEPNKIKGVINTIKYTDQGLAIVTNIVSSGKKGLVGKIANKTKGSGNSKIYLLDINTGNDLWNKSPKTKGIVSHFYVEDDGIIFGVATGGINKVGFDGKALWKKPHKTGAGIQILATVPKGLLYISSTDTDILDMNTGESVFGKAIKYKRSKSVLSTYDKDRDRFLLYCKAGVYQINGNNGEYGLINDAIKFEGKEVPTNIAVRESGILLSSNQNLELLDFDGKNKWNVYHRPPGKSAFGVIVLGALTAVSGATSMAASAKAGYMKGSGVPSYNRERVNAENGANASANIADASFKEMTKRFKATKATKNASFMLTKLDGGVGLVKVNKDTGNTESEIVLKDKKPMYEVDDIEGILYFKSKRNTISAYKLTK